MKFSIVVPVHNAAAFLAEGLDSLLRQRHGDWEALCVDNGSTDESPAILAEYARRDRRFRVITLPPVGVSAARNVGLAAATGDYVAFFDADDAIDERWLSVAADQLREHPVDLLRMSLTKWNEGSPRPRVASEALTLRLIGPRDRVCAWGWIEFLERGWSWLNFIRRTVAVGIEFPVGLGMKEDNVFMVRLLRRLDSAAVYPFPGYFYRQHASSAARARHSVREQNLFRKALQRAWCEQRKTLKALPEYGQIRERYVFYRYLRFVREPKWSPIAWTRRIRDAVARRLSTGWRRFLAALTVLAALLLVYAWTCVPNPAHARIRVSSPEPRLLLVQCDFTPAEQMAVSGLWRFLRVIRPWWVWKHEARSVHFLRPSWEAALRDVSRWSVGGHTVKRIGYWKSPVGQTRFPDISGRPMPVRAADVVYHVFLELDRPLTPEQSVSVTTPFGTRREVVRATEEVSPFIKVNQVGYAPFPNRRYAYLGGWLGTAGAWRLPEGAKSFELVCVSDGKVARSGCIRPRPADVQTKDGTPWTGENTYEIDLSGDLPCGRYYVRVPGVGRSQDFKVSSAGVREALNVQLHGLFVQRCGSSEKHAPATAWGDEPCHLQVWRGTFPPEERDYQVSDSATGRFADDNGHWVAVSHFDLIERNTDWGKSPESFPGGWHDAADYDRRPQHLTVVSDLLSVWLSGPRDPKDPVLSEAAWGLEHLLSSQTEDGGVGTWFETTRHPVEGEGMPSSDTLRYAVSRPTRASTLAYASVAAQLARCTPELRERFLDSARQAWRWAHETPSATNVPFIVSREGRPGQVFWTEASELPPLYEVKAAVNLVAATGDRTYADGVLSPDCLKRFDEAMKKDSWKWSPLVLLEVFADSGHLFDPIAERIRRWVVTGADAMLVSQERQPYRLPRANGADLAWGKAHPLVLARRLVAAHAATGDPRYLEGLSLAYDYHCGINPDGMTLTSGLGSVFPVRFLSLQSTADAVNEYVAGISPYRWTYGAGRTDLQLVHTYEETVQWPIWRRRATLESLDVGSGEYTVWETLGPAVAVLDYLASLSGSVSESDKALSESGLPSPLPGYWALP